MYLQAPTQLLHEVILYSWHDIVPMSPKGRALDNGYNRRGHGQKYVVMYRMSGCRSHLQGKVARQRRGICWVGNDVNLCKPIGEFIPKGLSTYPLHPWLCYLGSTDLSRGVSAIGHPAYLMMMRYECDNCAMARKYSNKIMRKNGRWG